MATATIEDTRTKIAFRQKKNDESYCDYNDLQKIWEKNELSRQIKVGNILTYDSYHCDISLSTHYIITKVTEKTISMKRLSYKAITEIDKTYGNYMAELINTDMGDVIKKNKSTLYLYQFVDFEDKPYDLKYPVPRSIC